MAIVISGNGIDMGGNPVSNASQVDSSLINASQIDSTVINENGDNVATTSNLVGFKNYIINGGFDIWQRGTSFTSTGYTADRWYMPNGTASRIQDSYYNNIKVTGTGLAQGIEFIGISQQGYFEIGKTFTLSWYARNDSSLENITCYAVFRNSVADPTNQVLLFNNVGGGNLSTQWKRYSYTFTIDKSANNGNKCLEIGFYTPSGTNTYIRDVQLEEGSVATPFEQRPIGLELSLCQRYYRKSFDINITPSNAGSSDTINDIVNAITTTAPHRGRLADNINTCSIPFGVEMRITPTVQRYGNSSGYWFLSDSTTARFDNNIYILATTKGLIIDNEVSTDINVFVVGHYTADAEL